MGFKEIQIFYVEESLKELSAHTQAILMGGFGLKIRNFLIRKIFDSHKANLRYAGNINGSILKFKILKKIRDILFLPLAFILKPLVKNRGLYFQAKI
ncbi:MAG: hypothetical protein KatS3mg093_005 [Candidatus Parcubacteria bacterium]|nr:MAG: hypothetical protein KatS3mg093_005 [Candidatus Parcubacteria bacterium]